MLVHEVMRREPFTVRSDDHLSTAMQLMLWRGFRHVPVLDNGTLVGVLSEHDVLRFRAEHAGRGLDALVEEAMTRPARGIGPDESAATAAGRMANEHINCLPVLRGDELVGIVTATDLLRALEHEHFAGIVSGLELPGLELTVEQLMSTDLVTVEVDDSLADAAARMAHYGIRHLPVVDGTRRLLGMLSDRDLRLPPALLRQPSSEAAQDFLERTRVRQVMTADAMTITPGPAVADLAAAFVDGRLSAVPVLDKDRRLVGVVSYIDMLRGPRRRASAPVESAAWPRSEPEVRERPS